MSYKYLVDYKNFENICHMRPIGNDNVKALLPLGKGLLESLLEKFPLYAADPVDDQSAA